MRDPSDERSGSVGSEVGAPQEQARSTAPAAAQRTRRPRSLGTATYLLTSTSPQAPFRAQAWNAPLA